MADWRANLHQASFRGVKFYVSYSQEEHALNAIEHEIPGGDEPIPPDIMGRKAEKWPVRAFLVGNDAYFTRDLLRKAFQKQQPGRLIHPLLGIKNAICIKYRCNQTFDTRGKINLTLTFMEAGKPKNKSFLDSLQSYIDKGNDLLQEAALAFADGFSVVDQPAYILASATNMVYQVASFITSKNGLGTLPNAMNNIKLGLDGAREQLESLVNAPKELAKAFQDAVENLTGKAPIELVKNISVAPGTGRDAKNSKAIKELVETAVTVKLAKDTFEMVSPELNKDGNLNEVLELQKNIDDLVGSLQATAPDNVFISLSILRANVEEQVRQFVQRNPSQKIEKMTGLPSLLASFRLFQDINREQSLIVSNQIENPLSIGISDV